MTRWNASWPSTRKRLVKRRGTEEEAAVTRSEEEVRVGKRATVAGEARLRKWVETEPVSEQVEVRRESATVTREPIDQPATGR